VIFGDTETTPPWEALDEFLQKKFAHESGAALRILATAVDAGYRTQTVFGWCRTRLHRHIFPVRGQSQAGKTILGRPTKQDVDHRGEKIPNGVDLWPIGTDTAKSKIYARLKIARRARAACTSRSACPTSTTRASPPSAWCRATTAAS
jgi:phage terminase large subunit GpA-like protein